MARKVPRLCKDAQPPRNLVRGSNSGPPGFASERLDDCRDAGHRAWPPTLGQTVTPQRANPHLDDYWREVREMES